MPDLFFKSVRIVDGTGRPAVHADVLVQGDRIAATGALEAPAGCEQFNGLGLVLCPGFIDVHTHDDLALLREPDMVPKTAQGVTTVVAGNCGIGVAPVSAALGDALGGPFLAILGPAGGPAWQTFDQYLKANAAAPAAVNAAFLVPHAAIRLAVMGPAARPASQPELAAMRSLLADCMAAGAIGMSTGLVYEPARFAGADELTGLAAEVARQGGIYAAHIRDEGDHLVEALREAITVGERSAAAVQISHLKAVGRSNWGKLPACLNLIREARQRGQRVGADVYPYTAAATSLGAVVRIHGTDSEARGDGIRITYAPGQQELEGKSLPEIAAEYGTSQREAARRILARSESVMAVTHVMAEDGVEDVLRFEGTMIGSDGLPNPDGRTHPRTYGTFPRVLGRYVRARRVLGLEEAVHRMTGLPAATFGLDGRGLIVAGAPADLVLFDPATIGDRATYQEPSLGPEGIRLVVVNGEVVMRDGVATGRRPGRVLTGNGR
jgi:N-acyl-D-aspartate/D-glutamate deacylase